MNKSFWNHQIRRVQLRSRLLFTRPTRFMVAATARSGSTMLMSLLNSHPRIRTLGELYNADRVKSRKSEYENPKETFDTAMRRTGFETAIGAKFLYHQLQPEHGETCDIKHFDEFVQYIEGEHSLRVIHLIRKNLMRSVISAFVGQETGQWVAKGSSVVKSAHINVDPERCLRWMNGVRNWEQQVRERFGSHPMLELVYEDLIEDQSGQSGQILSFLGVDQYPLATQMKKQGKPLKETVSNFEELQSFFGNTEFAWMLEA